MRLLTTVLILGLSSSTLADALSDRVDAKIEQLRTEARVASRPLLLYPEDLRSAMLEISQDPALVVRLHEADNDKAVLGPLLDDYPSPMRLAARELAREREVLQILSDNLVMVGILGAVYADDPEGLRALLDARAREGDAKQEEALAAWQKRLEDDRQAREQLEQAAKAYDEQSATTVVSQDGDATNVDVTVNTPSGMARSDAGQTVVYAEPSYSFSLYVMDHCDVYWHACGGMYAHYVDWDDAYEEYWDEYWDRADSAREDWQEHLDQGREDRQQFFEENKGEDGGLRDALERSGNGGMSQAMEDWKAKNEDALPADFDKGELAQRFKEYGDANRAFKEGLSSGRYSGSERSGRIKADQLRVREQARARQPSQLPSQVRERTRPSAGSALERSRGDAGLRRSGSGMQRGSMSRSQRVERARGAHRSSWGSRSGGFSRGGGVSRSGGRRGGGRRR